MFVKGRFVNINPDNPDAVGRCDRSGLVGNYSDLVKQMDYRGSGLVWTGLYVNKHFLDVPNPQGLNPIIKVDPVPVDHPRPWYTPPNQQWPYNTQTWSTTTNTTWASWGDWRNQDNE
jgi:hypothetical protein